MAKVHFLICVAGFALLASAPAMAAKGKPHPRQTRSHYSYALAHSVREGFREMPQGRYHSREDFYAARESYYRQSGEIVENLRGDFTGGVGAGADAFIDGYGQTHFYVGSFRGLNRLPHGPYGPQRFAPGGRAF
ncbi:MAG TPA: hypothetical protein VGM68_00920 [Rhizomicrobium sp.]|jgi:hypothetical protein